MSTQSSSPTRFETARTGRARARGWLRRQLEIQRDGLTTYLADHWPDIAQSKWIGGHAEGWERGPYWLDGAVALAFALDDEALKKRAGEWINAILERQHEDGWLGEKNDPHDGSGEQKLDPWPLALVFKAFAQWHEATGDERIQPAMARALKRIDTLLDEKPLENWAKMRWFEIALGALWLHERTGEAWLLDVAAKMAAQGYDWGAHFENFEQKFGGRSTDWTLENHVVNQAMGLKERAVRARIEGAAEDGIGDLLIEALLPIDKLDHFHGQANGMFSGDESLAGLSPSQGTELCTVVEYLFSLQVLAAQFEHEQWGDKLERIAFNALPATFTSDMWAHQYDQQVNQVLVSHAKRDWVSNGDDANIFGLEPNFGCCTANMHQGWPKLVQSLVLRERETGSLVFNAYAPCQVEFDDVKATLETEYPFRDAISITLEVSEPREFEVRLRIPSWAQNAEVEANGERVQVLEEGFVALRREWKSGDRIALRFPMSLRFEDRPNKARSAYYGPLLLGLKIEEDFRHLKGEAPACDWEVHPASPWNYALEGDTSTWQVLERPLGERPFSPEGAPIEVKARARKINWPLHNNSAAPPPTDAVCEGEVEDVTLLPYGATHLRVAEFPVCEG